MLMVTGAGSIFAVGSLLISGPLTMGLTYLMLKLDKGEVISVEMMFVGFNNFSRSFTAGVLIALYTFLWSLLLIVPGIIASISYSMTFFIMQENPNITPSEAIIQSKDMMMGHKWRFFELSLSFLGWFFLSLITFGLGFLYVGPYYYAAVTVFYQDLKGEQGNLGVVRN
jgi:uncharacterized membrane protein